MARVEDIPSEEDDEPEVIIEDDATEQEEIDNESEASDDMSESEEAERALESKLALLEQQINSDPYNYEQHIQLIQHLDKLCELDRMRSAFQRLDGLMPLRPEHWLAWTQTEGSMAHSEHDREAVHQLYRRATARIYSIPLYLQWLVFAMSGPVQEARDTFATVMRRTGYDPAASSDVWRAIVEFEKMHLSELSSEEEGAGVWEQEARVLGCLARQLVRPLLHTDAALEEMQQLKHCVTEQREAILRRYEELKGLREQILVFEDRLHLAELNDKVEIYKEYIGVLRQMHESTDSDKDGDDGCNFLEMCACLYDRATYECLVCENVDTLMKPYARLAASLPEEEAARALEVCVARRPTVAEYWVLTMQHLERHKQPFEEITAVLERALSDAKLSRQGSEQLWLGYLECLRRHTEPEQAEQRDKLRSNLSHAASTLQMMYGQEADQECELMLFWARLEYGPLDSPTRGKEIFEEIFQNGYYKSQSRLWLQLIELEQSRHPRPPDKKLRDLHRRAVKFTTDYAPAVCQRWIAFERDYGTLETAVQCRDVCEEAMEQWRQSYQTQKESKQNAKKTKNKKYQHEDSKKSRNDGQTEVRARGKKRAAEGDGREEVKKKKDSTEKEEEIKQNGIKRTHEDAGVNDVDSKRQRLTSEETNKNTEGAVHEHVTPEKEANTLFVSNLDFKFNEKHLRDALSAWGTISALRFVRGVKAFGGSICYCEYTTSESVDKAIKHDRTPLDGRPMFLSRYRPSRGKETKFRYPTTAERNKLFVKNLPFSCCTEEKLREVFAPHGALKDIRVVTRKDGKPKGLAYIEYEDEKSASTALQATDGLLLEDRNIEVAFSSPPPREISAAAAEKPSLGQGRRDTNTERRRTQLSSLVPRVLQKPVSLPGPSSGAPAAKPLSNTDFRNMLLNNK